jgi:integrase
VIRGTLRRAVKNKTLGACPPVEMLTEAAPREGFFEPEQVTAVLRHLPAELRPVVEVANETGWRLKSEILPLEWNQVDLDAGTVTLREGTTKSGEGRRVPFTTRLREIFTARDRVRKALKKRGIITPLVFFRETVTGVEPILSMRDAWKRATRAAGCPGRHVHDFRRTVVRDLDRAGVPQKVQMSLVGHKTASINLRYRIVDETDKRDAAAALDAYRASSTTKSSKTRGGRS